VTKLDAIRKALRPGWAPTIDELRPVVERALKQVVGRHKLYALLSGMQKSGEIGVVGRAAGRRYVRIQ